MTEQTAEERFAEVGGYEAPKAARPKIIQREATPREEERAWRTLGDAARNAAARAAASVYEEQARRAQEEREMPPADLGADDPPHPLETPSEFFARAAR